MSHPHAHLREQNNPAHYTINTNPSASTSASLHNHYANYHPGLTSSSRPRSPARQSRYAADDSHSSTHKQDHTDKRVSRQPCPPPQPQLDCPRRDPSPLPPYSNHIGHLTKEQYIHITSASFDQSAEYNSNYIPLPTYSEPESIFSSVSRPQICTRGFITRLVTYTQCSPSAFIVMLIYLDRIADANPKLLITPFNMHRLLVTALTLACKVLDDRCYFNAHYARVGGIPTVREMNRLELQFLTYLNFRLHVTRSKYDEKVRSLENLPPTSPISANDGICGSPALVISTASMDDTQSVFSDDDHSAVSAS